jgi:hypothetical protein
MCNVFLHRLDRVWDVRAHGVLVRFADYAVVLCRTRGQAEAALERLRDLLAELGLAPKEAKTRIVRLQVGGEGVDFLGFHHRWVRANRRTGGNGVEFLARWPSGKAMQHARDRIRGLTGRDRAQLSVETIVGASTGSCAVGPGISDTETRLRDSPRSVATPCRAWRVFSPRSTSADAGTGSG